MSAAIIEVLVDTMSDADIVEGLDPILAAHIRERMEAQPELRRSFAIAALGRTFGWADDQ